MISLSNSEKNVSCYYETWIIVHLDASIVVLGVITRVRAQKPNEHHADGNLKVENVNSVSELGVSERRIFHSQLLSPQ